METELLKLIPQVPVAAAAILGLILAARLFSNHAKEVSALSRENTKYAADMLEQSRVAEAQRSQYLFDQLEQIVSRSAEMSANVAKCSDNLRRSNECVLKTAELLAARQ